MHPIEIIVIASVSAFLCWFVTSTVRRLVKGQPMIGSDCECCGGKGKKLVDAYHKEQKKCHCGCSDK